MHINPQFELFDALIYSKTSEEAFHRVKAILDTKPDLITSNEVETTPGFWACQSKHIKAAAEVIIQTLAQGITDKKEPFTIPYEEIFSGFNREDIDKRQEVMNTIAAVHAAVRNRLINPQTIDEKYVAGELKGKNNIWLNPIDPPALRTLPHANPEAIADLEAALKESDPARVEALLKRSPIGQDPS